MNDRRPNSAEKERQRRRLGAALRANLKRRKAQAKGRAAGYSETGHAAGSHDSAGIDPDKGRR